MSREELVGRSWEDSPGLRELLQGHDARAILFRLSDDDPLGLFDLCLEHMRHGAVLLDTRRVVMTAMSRIAYHGTHYDGSPPPRIWIAEQVEGAIRDLVEEDARELVDRVPLEPDDPRYANLAELLGIEPEIARAGCVVFQELPYEQRAAFWAVLVDGRPVEAVAAELGVSRAEVERRYERAVHAFCTLGLEDEAEGDVPPGEPEVGP